jgi:hypothetical protein
MWVVLMEGCSGWVGPESVGTLPLVCTVQYINIGTFLLGGRGGGVYIGIDNTEPIVLTIWKRLSHKILTFNPISHCPGHI